MPVELGIVTLRVKINCLGVKNWSKGIVSVNRTLISLNRLFQSSYDLLNAYMSMKSVVYAWFYLWAEYCIYRQIHMYIVVFNWLELLLYSKLPYATPFLYSKLHFFIIVVLQCEYSHLLNHLIIVLLILMTVCYKYCFIR